MFKDTKEMELEIFTLNCWGLPLVSKHLNSRILAIGDVLANGNFDIVCLQEVWCCKDFEIIKEKAHSALPYSHYFHSGVVGSGICVLSKHPIVDVFYHQWSVNGYIHKIHHGDWFGGKGVGLCKLLVNGYTINVYTAHLHAEYNRNSDLYKTHRVLQAFDTAHFIHLTSGTADLVVLAGDLNTEPGDLAYKLLLGVPGLKDAFDVIGTDSKVVATNESRSNSYTPSLVSDEDSGKRIDHIMFHPGSNLQIAVKDYALPLPDRVPNEDFSYSDHEAISAVFVITKDKAAKPESNPDNLKSILEETIMICQSDLRRLEQDRCLYLISAFMCFILLGFCFAVEVPIGFTTLFNVFKVLLGILLVFILLMGTLWNRIEKSGILGGKLSMELFAKKLSSSDTF